METKKRQGILSRIFGKSKKENCCAIELEEIPTQNNLQNSTIEKAPVCKGKKTKCCGE